MQYVERGILFLPLKLYKRKNGAEGGLEGNQKKYSSPFISHFLYSPKFSDVFLGSGNHGRKLIL
jgi:hypothetical protein